MVIFFSALIFFRAQIKKKRITIRQLRQRPNNQFSGVVSSEKRYFEKVYKEMKTHCYTRAYNANAQRTAH